MKQATTLLLALLLVFLPIPAQATTVTGTVKLPDGTAVNGTIEFILSQQARTTSPPALYANMKTTCSITSGAIAGGCTVQGNDTLDPAGTFYSVKIVDSNNVEIMPATKYTISGASVDLGTLAIAADATLQLPSGSVTGNLTITGNLTVSGLSSLTAPVTATSAAVGDVPLLAKGASGQTADLFQLQNNAAANLVKVSSAGNLTLDNAADAALSLAMDSGSTAAQDTDIDFLDRGTLKTRLRTSSSATFVVSNDDGLRVANLAGTLRVRLHGDADKITLGSAGDTNLQRMAANVLGTDDAFTIGRGLGMSGFTGSLVDGAMGMFEITAPSAPPANNVYLYTKDNGSGKTQLCAIFNTGAEQCFATQP